jgi:CRP-like cAMP-binding protein
MKSLVENSTLIKQSKNSFLFREGEPLKGFYITLTGEYRASKLLPLLKPN